MMKILNYGSLNYDYVYTVPHIAAEGETISAEGMECHLGGKGLNQSVAIARAGSRVYQGGAAGSDGDRFFEFCAANGVSTEFIERMEGACGCAFIQVDSSSENCIVLYSGTNKRQSREHIDQVLESFEEGDLLILQNEINELPYLIDRAYERGMRIVLNPSPYNSQVEESDLNKIEFFLLNEVEGEQISGSREPEKILSYMKRRFPEAKVVLNLPAGLSGAGGGYYSCRRYLYRIFYPRDRLSGFCQKKSGIRGESRSHCRVQKRSCRFHPLGRGSGSFRKFRMNLFCRNAAAPVKCHGRGGIFSLPVAKRHNLLYNA